MKKTSIFLLLMCSFILKVKAQDIEQMTKSQMFHSGNGSANLNNTLLINETEGVRFNYMLSGNYTPAVFGIAIPLSFTFCNRDLSFSNPFNTFRLSPSYRGYTLHIGTNSMTFSPYTLSGHQFTGIAVDISPPKSKTGGTIILGKMNLANATDIDNIGKINRQVYGFKIEHKTEKYHFSTSMLKVTDVDNLFTEAPKDNATINLQIKYFLTKKLYLFGDWGNSAITDDIRAEQYNRKVDFSNPTRFMVKNNLSTSVAKAYKIQAGYGFYSISFENVPNYRTLGAYYTNNNFYNLTVNASKQMKKVSVAGRFGFLQRTADEKAKTKQIVSSLNLVYTPRKGTFLSGAYSNFQTYSYIRDYIKESEVIDPYTYVDTLAYSCINQAADFSVSHTFTKNGRTVGYLNTFFSMQQVGLGNKIYINSASLSSLRRNGTSYGVTFQSNYQTETCMLTIGTGFFYGNRLLKNKMSWRVSINENNYFTEKKLSKITATLRGILSYKIDKNQSLQIQMSNLISQKYNFMFNAGYSYQW